MTLSPAEAERARRIATVIVNVPRRHVAAMCAVGPEDFCRWIFEERLTPREINARLAALAPGR